MAKRSVDSALTKLSYKTTGETYTKLALVKVIPDLGGERDEVDVTTLDDECYVNEPGLINYGTLEFEVLFNTEGITSPYRVCKGLEDVGNPVDWKIELSEGTTITFSGIPTTKINGFTVGDKLNFTLRISVNSEMVVVLPS